MRKKKHFKISSKNKSYDRFYPVNYLVREAFERQPEFPLVGNWQTLGDSAQ
jgi:hypothetical protein